MFDPEALAQLAWVHGGEIPAQFVPAVPVFADPISFDVSLEEFRARMPEVEELLMRDK